MRPSRRAQFGSAEIGVGRRFCRCGHHQLRFCVLELRIEDEGLTLGHELAELGGRQRRSLNSQIGRRLLRALGRAGAFFDKIAMAERFLLSEIQRSLRFDN